MYAFPEIFLILFLGDTITFKYYFVKLSFSYSIVPFEYYVDYGSLLLACGHTSER